MKTLYPSTNPAHARIAGWLNVWPDYVALNPLPTGINLFPLEQAFRMAGQEVLPRLDGPGFFRQFLYNLN